MSSPYQVLGVRRTATAAEIKSAYRRLAMRVHPDHGGNAAKFREVNKAYQLLIHPNRRHAYDQLKAKHRAGEAPYRRPKPRAPSVTPPPTPVSAIGLRIVGGFVADFFDSFVPPTHPLQSILRQARAERDGALADILRQ